MCVCLYVCQLTPCQAMVPPSYLHTHALNINVVQYHEYSWWPKSCTSFCSPRSPLDSMLTFGFSILGDLPKKSTLNKGEAGEWFALKSSLVGWCKILAINRCKKSLKCGFMYALTSKCSSSIQWKISWSEIAIHSSCLSGECCERWDARGPSLCGFSRSSRHDTPDLVSFYQSGCRTCRTCWNSS